MTDNLETIMARIDSLEQGLNAEKIIQEERYSTDCVWEPEPTTHPNVSTTQYGWPPGDFVQKTVMTSPEIVGPDEEKRTASREELNELYHASEWYCIKTRAGVLLDKIDVAKTVDRWIDELVEEASLPTKKYHNFYQFSLIVENVEKVEKAQMELKHLYDYAPTKVQRERSGLAIGKNKQEILYHEIELEHKISRNELESLYGDAIRSTSPTTVAEKRDFAYAKDFSVKKLGKLLNYLNRKITIDCLGRGELHPYELKILYTGASDSVHRVLAGQELGYSSLRIFLHETFMAKRR